MRIPSFACIYAVALVALARAAYAAPVLYDITFTQTPGSSTQSGSFYYDAVTTAFSNFSIDFNGQTLDFTAEANSPTADGTCGGSVSPGFGFAIMSGTVACTSNQVWSFTGESNIPFNQYLLLASRDAFTNDTAIMNASGYMMRESFTNNGDFDDGGTFTIAPTVVSSAPEPTLLGAGLAGLAMSRRRRKAA